MNVKGFSDEECYIDRASDELKNKRQLARVLQCSTRTVDDWTGKGRIPYIKLGKTVRFRWADVLEKLNEYRVN